jgi:hypothetical protein
VPEEGGVGHFAEHHVTGKRDKGEGFHGGCLPGYCAFEHPISECPNQPPDALLPAQLEATWAAVRSGDAIPAELVSKHSNIEYNRERNAVQVFGCHGALIAHIPLPKPAISNAE